MPWKECFVVDERLKFVGRLLEGERMSELCREFGISRKTGYKIFQRYEQTGLLGLTDRDRKPLRYAHQLPQQVEQFILGIKKEFPSWGAPKIREKLKRKYPSIPLPAQSTIHCILDRHGLVKRHKKRRYKAEGTALQHATHPNDLWCADYKGEFMLQNHQYCYPLTITDYHSRFLLSVEGLESTRQDMAFSVFERTFQEFGLPKAIRTDNGVPFAAGFSLFGLTKLSVWWLRLGVELERIKPGHPEQNGRHERMHLTLKKETVAPAAENFLQQQSRFDDFIEEFNTERPHQALQMKTPAEVYTPSPRIYAGLPDVEYPAHDASHIVTFCGRLCHRGKKINLTQALAGQRIGIKQTDDKIWLVSFMNYDLGYFDEDSKKFEPLENPFGPKVVNSNM